MHTTTHLPDAMPDIEKPTLFLICDTHHCRIIDVGGKTVMTHGQVDSKEHATTDRPDKMGSPTGMTHGATEMDQIEGNRLHEFSNQVSAHLDQIVLEQKIEEIYIAAPDKFLAELKKHLSKHAQSITKKIIDGNFMHESLHQVLIRLRPDLAEAIHKLRAQENYSEKNHLPK